MRAPSLADFDAFATFYADPRSHFVGGPLNREQAWRYLAQEAGHWALQGYGRWILAEKATGDAVGMVGLWYPHGFPEHELGWDLFNGATGKGYATEAATTARHYAYETLGWTTLISLIAEGNDASAAVARRLGARPDGVFTHERLGAMQIMRHPAPDAAQGTAA